MAKTSLTDMAKTITRSRMGIRTPRAANAQPIVEIRPRPQPETPPAPPTPTVYTATPDSWDPRYRPMPEAPASPPREERVVRPSPPSEAELKKVPEILITEEGFETRTSLRMKKSKLRKTCMSLSLSEEEARIVRNHVNAMNTNFSTWARNTLFRAIGKPVPARPKKVY